MAGYGWSQLSQWEIGPHDAYIRLKPVNTGLSRGVCKFMLVKRTDQGEGYLRCEYIKKDNVTQEILEMAGKI